MSDVCHMSEYPGAMIPAKCHDCGRTYFVSKAEHDEPGAVCKDCWDAWGGMTAEQLCDAIDADTSDEGRPLHSTKGWK